MLIGVITDRTQVVIIALSALPPDAVDRLLPARIAHRAVMFNARRCTVQDSEKSQNVEIV